jgi:hypothetical protein
VTSTNWDQGMSPGDVSFQSSGMEMSVKVELMRELGSRYAEYRQAMSTPLTPCPVLALTGQVLETVNRILTSSEKPSDTARTHRGSGND